MANSNLNQIQFNQLSYEKDISGGMGSINASHPEHGQIGQIFWNTDPKYKAEPVGGVTNLTVHPDFQRQGLGTHLFQQAQAYDPRVQHSTNLTKDGKKFVDGMSRKAAFNGEA
jgi:GNAT superfamily N-acetyltransferase